MKKTLISATLLATVPLIAVVGSAMAQPPADASGRGERMWERLDSDGDGEVLVTEIEQRAAARALERAQEMDSNGDGVVTKEEAKAFHRAKKEKRRAKREARRFPDENGDGVVSREEFIEAAETRFDRLDKNADGVLSEDEKPKGNRRRRR